MLLNSLNDAVRDLVIANRILAHEGVVDAYGHISLRHPHQPTHFLLAQSRSPALVEASDIMEFLEDGTVVGEDKRHPYIERFIHGSIYSSRPDVMAVAHSHASEVLPYTVSPVALYPVIHSAGVIGAHVPTWDIRHRFGDTNMLVTNLDHGNDLAASLGTHSVVLMRGHGFAAVGRSLIEVIRICIYLRVNAAVLSEASRHPPVIRLSEGEIAAIRSIQPGAPELHRAWHYWATRAGCASMLAP